MRDIPVVEKRKTGAYRRAIARPAGTVNYNELS